MTHDLIIIGGGPAAVAAGVYAARKKLNTLVIAKTFAGQSVVSTEIYNWIGTQAISGEKLSKDLELHLKSYTSDTFVIEEGVAVTEVTGTDGDFTVVTDAKKKHHTKTVLVATGGDRRKLTVPGAAELDHKGLTYCATCDGPLFSGMDVAVVGGGNAGFESAAQLLAYVKSVTLLEYASEFKADAVTVEKVLKNENMKALANVEVLEIQGEKMVSGIKYKNRSTGEETVLPVQGVFVEIGMVPNTGFVEGVVKLTDYKKIVVNPRTQQTSCPGVWAAGDCTDGLYAQNNIAVGDAVKAVEDLYNHLKA
jgi:alkyl hydroperoxide reductase subunit F